MPTINSSSRRTAKLWITLLAILFTLTSGLRAAGLDSPVTVIMPSEVSWRYTNDYPANDWMKPGFKDSDWAQGSSPFGNQAPDSTNATAWTSGQIWLRRTIDISKIPANPQLAVQHRGDIQVYINGKLAMDAMGNTRRPVPIPIQGEAQASLRRGKNTIAVHCTAIGEAPFISICLEDAADSGTVQAPIYRDPRFDGAADPVVVWNREQKCWTMFYTQRRANLKYLPNVGYCYGSDIGMAISKDGGQSWLYAGEALGLEFKGGKNTFWAPEVFFSNGFYHMFVSYIAGVHNNWEGSPTMVHFTSTDLKHWSYSDTLPMNGVIDASVFPLQTGGWRMFYKQDSKTFTVDSPDLRNWSAPSAAVTDVPHEGPNVFRWKGHYWMIVDVWRGQKVYRSEDLKTWTAQADPNILGAPGKRRDDGAFGRHADVLVQGDRAFILYFTHPGGDTDHVDATSLKRTSVQVAELEYVDGRIVCDRDKPVKKYHWNHALMDW